MSYTYVLHVPLELTNMTIRAYQGADVDHLGHGYSANIGGRLRVLPVTGTMNENGYFIAAPPDSQITDINRKAASRIQIKDGKKITIVSAL